MRKSRYSEEQIIAILKEAEQEYGGLKVARHGGTAIAPLGMPAWPLHA